MEITFGSTSSFNNANYCHENIGLSKLSDSKIIIIYSPSDSGEDDYNLIYTRVGNIGEDNSISWGPVKQITTEYLNAPTQRIDISALSSSSAIIAYYKNDNTIQTVVASIDESDNITLGTPTVLDGGNTNINIIRLESFSSTKFVIMYTSYADAKTAGRIGTISSGNISYGNEETLLSSYSDELDICKLSSTKFAFSFRNASDGFNKIKAVVGSFSDTTLSFGTIKEITSNTRYGNSICALSSSKIAFGTQDGIGSNAIQKLVIGTIDESDNITLGSESGIYSGLSFVPNIISLGENNVIFSYWRSIDSNGDGSVWVQQPFSHIVTVNGTSFSYGNSFTKTLTSETAMTLNNSLALTDSLYVLISRGKPVAIVGEISTEIPSSNFFLFFN